MKHIVDLSSREKYVVELSPEERAERESAEAAWLAGQAERERAANKASILAQLAALDTKRARPLSDIALGNGDAKDEFGKTPRQRLIEMESSAAALRKKLV